MKSMLLLTAFVALWVGMLEFVARTYSSDPAIRCSFIEFGPSKPCRVVEEPQQP